MKNRLHEYRMKRLLTQRELAKESGISQVTISFIETGRGKKVMPLTKQKLANALRVSVHELFPPEDKDEG